MSARAPVGARRRQLTLEAPVDVVDDNGGVARTYTAIATLWARVSPRAGVLAFQADQQRQVVTHDIIFRARDGMTGAMRFRLGARLFQILALSDVDDRGVLASAACEEIKP